MYEMIRMVAEELSIEKKMVRQIITKNLNVRKVCQDYTKEFEQRTEVEKK
jgi:hypothetical protein